jgi:hypothetical protein
MSEIEKFKYILRSNDLDICKICILSEKDVWFEPNIKTKFVVLS